MNIIFELLNNKIFFITIIAWFIAQVIKIIIDIITQRKFDITLLVSTGGMPSSHSAFTTSLATCVGLQEGFNSSLFAICFVFSTVVMYDAAGIRRAAGKQAKIINLMIQNGEKHGLKIDEKMKELLGHTPIEVTAGALLGIIIALLLY